VRKNNDPMETLIQKKELELLLLQEQDHHDLPELEAPIIAELNNLLEQEEKKWQQRAKVNWLKFGDKNSKYFHACASQKQKRRNIQQIKDKEGHMCTNQGDIENAFIQYFQELFTAGKHLEVEACMRVLEPKVTELMNQKLLADFTEEDISIALNQMAPLKAPGPDGFSACFYKNNWDDVKSKVCSIILLFLNTGVMKVSINETLIALIPKTKNPSHVTEFRPISLCNVVYKIISKGLANRLKIVLPDIISCHQSAFIQGRLITDNILAAFETLHADKDAGKNRIYRP
jgi:hypothetical protein